MLPPPPTFATCPAISSHPALPPATAARKKCRRKTKPGRCYCHWLINMRSGRSRSSASLLNLNRRSPGHPSTTHPSCTTETTWARQQNNEKKNKAEQKQQRIHTRTRLSQSQKLCAFILTHLTRDTVEILYRESRLKRFSLVTCRNWRLCYDYYWLIHTFLYPWATHSFKILNNWTQGKNNLNFLSHLLRKSLSTANNSKQHNLKVNCRFYEF